MPFPVYLFQTAAGKEVVKEQLERIRERERQAWTPISIGLRMLAEFGADPTLNKFKRLRYTGNEAAIWELRAQGRPAYRLLFAQVPGDNAFVVLDVVRKDEMARDSARAIELALRRLDEWLREVRE